MAALDPTSLGFTEGQLRNWKLLQDFQARLRKALAESAQALEEADPKRLLLIENYFSLLMFGLLNPVVRTMRGLCAASRLDRVQAEVCGRAVSLGSFSEAQHVFDPELLSRVLRDCADEAPASFGDPRVREYVQELTANDGTLLPALPRMAWALYQDEQHRAGKLHLEFSVFRQVPTEWTLTSGNGSERKAWEKKLKRGGFYVNDRNYSHDYKLIPRVQKAGASFVLRLHNNAILTEVGERRPLTEADRQAGVVRDVRVRLGREPDGPEVRLVEVQSGGHIFLLITDRQDIPAELIALIYRYRWQIELFFKWVKCILGCRHLLAESPEGVAAQIYCALIAATLLTLYTGRKPNKRAMEALQLYWLGYASLDELCVALKIEKKANV